MKIKNDLITVTFYFVAFSLSLSTLAYGSDQTQEKSYYCPGYANCTGMDCRYNQVYAISEWNSFNTSDKEPIRCDSLDVNFDFPDSKDDSFVRNETWTCYRYYDGVGHHLALIKIILNKPSDVDGSQVHCQASIGNCTLFNETSFEMTFIAGLPNTCVTWTDDIELMLPSETETFECPEYKNCSGNICHFHRTSSQATITPFLKSNGSVITCDLLTVDIFYPGNNGSKFFGMENFTCFQYVNDKNVSFPVLEISVNKPEDMNGTQLTCYAESTDSKCAKYKETSSELLFVAGLPSTCYPWTFSTLLTPTPTPTPTPSPAPVARLEFATFVVMAAALFIRQYM